MRHADPFPGLAPDQPVGPLGNRRQMEFLSSVTLHGMAQGAAGEPEHVIRLAQQILRERARKQEASA